MDKKIGIVGAGVMGHGIAEVFAVAGFEVILGDVNDELLSKAMEKIKWSVNNLAKKGKLKENPDKIAERITVTADLGAFSSVDYIIEAVREDSDTKRAVWEKLDSIAKPECIFSSNTSTIPISELASMSKRHTKFIGLHFSNPPVIMPLVEIIMGDKTEQETLVLAIELMKAIGKDYVVLHKDVPGFLINRLNDKIILEAMNILEEGTRKEDLDAMVRFRLNFPMGICELLDFVGIDTVYNANRELSNHGFTTAHSSILKEKVDSGKLGMKSGEGFYKYSVKNTYSRQKIIPSDNMYMISPIRLLSAAVNEAAWIIRNGVATREDVEKSMIMAMNWPEGLLSIADKYGIGVIISNLNKRYEETKESRYITDPLLEDMLNAGTIGIESG
ncbi:MAG: 3-hydroxyacyl-CoA dehydrogenase, partial [Thermoplasmataceae archaeon]